MAGLEPERQALVLRAFGVYFQLPLHATREGGAGLSRGGCARRIERTLPKLTGRTLARPAAELRKDVEAIRERGYAVEREEVVLGEAGVAARIFNRRAEPIGAIGVAGPAERILRRGREPQVAAAVVEAARGISRDLGAPRWPAV